MLGFYQKGIVTKERCCELNKGVRLILEMGSLPSWSVV